MDALGDLGCWIASNLTTLVELLFTGVVAWAAVIGVRLNRRLVDAELDPAISVYVEPDRFHLSFMQLVIKNTGRGSARNVSFAVEPNVPIETNYEESQLTRMAIFQRGIAFMAPLQEIRTFYGSLQQLHKEPITIHVACDRDAPQERRRRIHASFVIDAQQFHGFSRVGETPEKTVARAVGKLATDLHAIRAGGSWSNMTVTVKRRYFFSAPINQRWNRLSRRWRNFHIGWANRKEPRRRRWDRLRHPLRK